MKKHKFKEWPNPVDIHPIANRVLVAMEPVSETVGGEGLIAKPSSVKVVEEVGQVYGKLIACGEYAFSDRAEALAQPGDDIIIAKYAGILLENAGDIKYRIIKDDEVLARRGEE
jgi:co-chaperonin GroES (HSP10)